MDLSTDKVHSVKPKCLSQGWVAFWKLHGAGDGIQGLDHARQVLSTAELHPQPYVVLSLENLFFCLLSFSQSLEVQYP